jgi:hypothetical protein
MTTVSVRRIFKEMHLERVVSRDGYDQSDQEFSTAKFLSRHMVSWLHT